MKIIGESSPT